MTNCTTGMVTATRHVSNGMTSFNLQWLENQWRHEADAIKLSRGSNLPFILKIQVFIQGTTMKGQGAARTEQLAESVP
jgi:hypothetical protein